MHAAQVPATGGDTLFSHMGAASDYCPDLRIDYYRDLRIDYYPDLRIDYCPDLRIMERASIVGTRPA